MNRPFRYQYALAFAFILFAGFYSQAQENARMAVELANTLGLDAWEQKCVQEQDRKCLFERYQTIQPGNPLQATTYSDTVSWKHMAVSFRNTAGQFREKAPQTCIELYKRVAVLFALADNFRQSIYAVQSIGFIYEEQQHRFDSSLYFINQALMRWEDKGDTINAANLYKYRAYLSGHLGTFDGGKRDARKAIILYSAKGIQDGIMVSYRDLSEIFIKEQQFDSANYYLAKAKTHWVAKKDTFRIVTINTDLIRANVKKPLAVEPLLSESDGYLTHYEMPKVAAISYYTAATGYTYSIGDKVRHAKYTALRKKLED